MALPQDDDPGAYHNVFKKRTHSPFIINGRPADLQPLDFVEPIDLHGKEVPKRKWLVPDLIPEGNVTMIAGDGGIGKSLISLQLMVACALGRDWLGNSVRPCKAIGVFCEDSREEIHARLSPILQHYHATMADLEDMKYLCRVGEDNLLMDFAGQYGPGEETNFMLRLRHAAEDFGAELMVLDSLHDFFGGNENSRPQARQFIGSLRTLAMRQAGAVVLNSHPSMEGMKSGSGTSGSTAWHNAIRSRWYLTAPDKEKMPDADMRILANKKSNYSQRGKEMEIKYVAGVFITRQQDGTYWWT